jgi:DNA-binding transcriptional regulator YhcF (GntR family)
MKNSSFFDTICVDSYSATPKYLQLAHSILGAIESGKIEKNNLLPSLNELTYNLEISRETADKGYKYLQNLGVLNAIPGKGHYINTTEIKQKVKLCLLVNKISDEKKTFYDALVEELGVSVPIDFYVFHNDFKLFKRFISKQKEYSHYLIMPHFLDNREEAEQLINKIPKSKLILLDKRLNGVDGKYACIYEDFEDDVFNALEKALNPLSKYHTLKLVFPQESYFPNEIKNGFKNFCLKYAFERKYICDVENEEIKKGEVYICLTEHHLVDLVEKLQGTNLEIGKDVGIISYNETPLKKYILNGITTISTDYKSMGLLAAKAIKEGTKEDIKLKFSLTMRASL